MQDENQIKINQLSEAEIEFLILKYGHLIENLRVHFIFSYINKREVLTLR